MVMLCWEDKKSDDGSETRNAETTDTSMPTSYLHSMPICLKIKMHKHLSLGSWLPKTIQLIHSVRLNRMLIALTRQRPCLNLLVKLLSTFKIGGFGSWIWVYGFGFMVVALSFWVYVFVFTVLGLCFCVHGLGFEGDIPNAYLDACLGSRVKDFGFRYEWSVFCVCCLVSSVSGYVLVPVSSFLYFIF